MTDTSCAPPAAFDVAPDDLEVVFSLTTPCHIAVAADVVVCPHESGSYTVLKNRFGNCVFPTVAIPEPPESVMTNDDINASSSSLPVLASRHRNPERTARFMPRVYAWMGAGVITSAATAYLVASHPDTHAALTSGATGVCVILAPFALIGVLGYTSYKGRPYLAAAAFTLLTALLGVTMSSIAVKATGDAAFAGDVVTSLLIASGMFGGLATLGYTTKRDLSGMGTFLFASLWGLILALIANVFIGSTGFQFAISGAGVLLFSVLIAYDVQRAKYAAVMGDGAAVLCALSLYLDFLNLFQFVLSMLGFSSRED
jgi:FtsH-binding integral membrane protein